jgi:hypothetical protein
MKIENNTIIRWDELDAALCPICKSKLELVQSGSGYFAEHCDRTIKMSANTFVASVVKNKNIVKKPEETQDQTQTINLTMESRKQSEEDTSNIEYLKIIPN